MMCTAEYCGKGSLLDVLKGGRKSAAKAAQLTWSRRLLLVSEACSLSTITAAPVHGQPACVQQIVMVSALQFFVDAAPDVGGHVLTGKSNMSLLQPEPVLLAVSTLQALDAAKGILHLHLKNIVHRDLKSPNLLVDSTWRVKVRES
jgi:serine/threonine protein kinase